MNDNTRFKPSSLWSKAVDEAVKEGLTPGTRECDERVREKMGLPPCLPDQEVENDAGQQRYVAIRAHLATLTTEELNDTAADALHWLSEVLTNPSDFTRASAERLLAQINPSIG